MRDRLEQFYEQELFAIRRLAAEFARDRPKIADRLAVESTTGESADPHVERLVESFAFLTARVRLKLEDEFPELTEALLGLLYPHYLAPIPSCSIAQFQLDPTQGQLTDGFTIPRYSRLISREVQGVPCRFRTAYPVTLWPLELSSVYQTAPFGSTVKLPAGLSNVEAMIRLELTLSGSMPWSALNLDHLRVFLRGDEKTTHQLYELLFQHCAGIYVTEAGAQSPVSALIEADAIQEVGFGRDDGLLPADPRSFPGYRLLTEYFTFPQKFFFVDITRLKSALSRCRQPRVDLCILLKKSDRSLEARVDKDVLRLGCTPIVNLFPHPAEPIRLTHMQTEYHILPDLRHRRSFEVYSVESVTSTNADTGSVTEYQPFFACRHGRLTEQRPTYWATQRRASPIKNDPGTEVWLSLVDLSFQPSRPAADVLSVSTICTNRDLPSELRTSGGESWGFRLEAQAPLRHIIPIVPPTTPFRLPAGEQRWRLLSHLALNHFSIVEGDVGADAFRELLKLYDYANTRVSMQQIAGIESISSRRKTARVGGGPVAGFCRGLEIEIQFDAEKYAGTGVYLLASVLDKFLPLYASVNSFTRLVTRLKASPEPFKSWPYRVGEQMLM